MAQRKKTYRRALNDRLAERPPRDGVAKGPMVTNSSSVRLDRPEQVAAAAIGAMVLLKAKEFGQTRAFERGLEELVTKCTTGLSPAEIMNLEVEAYEVLDWLVGGEPVDDETAKATATRDGEIVRYDPHAPFPALIRRAISEEFDLKIDYFSRQRGQMNTRRITPLRIEAETYVQAYCHARRAERVFRLNRITRCIPMGGQPLNRARADSRTSEVDAIQISLLDDD